MKQDEIGTCRLWMKSDEGHFVIHPDYWPALRTAFLSCAAVAAEINADRKADKAREAIEGGE